MIVTTSWQMTMLDWMRQIQTGATSLHPMTDEVVEHAVRVIMDASAYVGSRVDLVPALITHENGSACIVWEREDRTVKVTVRPGPRPVVIEREEGNLVHPSFGPPDILKSLYWLERAEV